MMDEIVEYKKIKCPSCEGTGKMTIKLVPEGFHANQSNRKLPLDYFCTKCKEYVTATHRLNYIRCRKTVVSVNKKIRYKETTSDKVKE